MRCRSEANEAVLAGESPLRVLETQSALYRHAQRNAFRHDARQLSKLCAHKRRALRPSPFSFFQRSRLDQWGQNS